MKTLIGPLAGCLLLSVMGCSSEEKATPGAPILMVGAFSKTGVSAVSSWGLAFMLAANDANQGQAEAGQPADRLLNFRAKDFDTKNDQTITVESTVDLVQNEDAKMVINGTSSDTVALSKLAYDEGTDNDIDVPIICVACSSPSLHNPDAVNSDPVVQAANRNEQGWIFGMAMSSLPQSRVLWNILKDKTPAGNLPGDLDGNGVVKISTIALNDAFGTGFQNAMQSVVTTESPGSIYEELRHPKDANPDTYDWSKDLAKLTDDQNEASPDAADPAPPPTVAVPDVIIEFTFPQFSLGLVKAYSGSIPFLHTHSMREIPVINKAGGKLDDQEGTSYLPSDGQSGEMFDERYGNTYKSSPRESQWDSGIYDGTFLFALGTVAATKGMDDPLEVTGAQIRDEMKKLNNPDGEVIRIGPSEFAKAVKLIERGEPIDYVGASGPCDFDAYGRALNRISHWRVKAGKVNDVAVYDCVRFPDTCEKM